MTPPLTVQTRRLAAITSQLVPTPSSRPPSVNPDDPASSERIRIINEAHRAPPQEVQLPRRAPDMSMGGAARPGMMVGGMEMQGRWGNQREYSTAASGRPAGSGGSGPSAGGKQPSPWTEEARYGYWLPIQTRWQDNDQYGHMNNAIYYHLFDTIANSYLISHCNLDPASPSSPIGLIVSSNCTYLAPLSFPNPVLAGLTVGKVGRSSIEWRIALWPAVASSVNAGVQQPNVAPGGAGILSRGVRGEVVTGHRIVGKCAAYGSFSHVFVDPRTRKSVEMPPQTREALAALNPELSH